MKTFDFKDQWGGVTRVRLVRGAYADGSLAVQMLCEGDEFCPEEVVSLFRGLNVCRASERKYVNVSRRTPIIEDLAGGRAFRCCTST